MKTIAALCSLFALTQAAGLLPLESSVVNVKSERNGQDYSYSIHENRRGIPIEQIPLQPLQPIQQLLQPLAPAEIKTSLEPQQLQQQQQQPLVQGQEGQEMGMLENQDLLKSRQPDKRIPIQQRTSILPLQLRQEYIPVQQYTAFPAAYYNYPMAYQQYQYYYPNLMPLQQYLYRL